MSNNKITDIVNYDIPKFNIDVNFEYAYYDEMLEDKNPVNDYDINLKNTNINLNMYNKIVIDISEFKNRFRFDSNFSFLQFIDEKVITTIKSYQNKNLYRTNDGNNLTGQTLEKYFNNSALQNNLDDKFISVVSNSDEKDRNKIISAYDKLNPNVNVNFSTQKFFRNTNLSKNYFYDIMLNKTNNLYNYETKNLEFFSSYSNVSNQKIVSNYNSKIFEININYGVANISDRLSENPITSEYDQTLLFEKLNHFYFIPPVENEIKMREQTGVAFIGFMITKNVSVSGSTLLTNDAKAGSQFVYVDINNLDNINDITLYDGLIRYSRSYSYEISPVFLLSLYKHNGVINLENIPVITFNMLSTHSYRTNKIFSYDYFAPEPPNGFHVNTRRKSVKSIELKWCHPTNPQQDVIGFQIYRRKSLTEAFSLIKVMLMKEISSFGYFNNSDNYNNTPDLIHISDSKTMSNEMYEYIDEDINVDKESYIYTICSIDAHGMVSNYSNQIGVRYSTIYNALIVDHVSDQNAPRTYPNLYIQRKTQLFKNEDILFDFTPNFLNKQTASIYFTPDLFELNIPNSNEPSKKIFDINNEYQLNLTRLTDLQTKNIRFKLS
jgi:hypothetical protein